MVKSAADRTIISFFRTSKKRVRPRRIIFKQSAQMKKAVTTALG
jgi:hypothetical protein